MAYRYDPDSFALGPISPDMTEIIAILKARPVDRQLVRYLCSKHPGGLAAAMLAPTIPSWYGALRRNNTLLHGLLTVDTLALEPLYEGTVIITGSLASGEAIEIRVNKTSGVTDVRERPGGIPADEVGLIQHTLATFSPKRLVFQNHALAVACASKGGRTASHYSPSGELCRREYSDNGDSWEERFTTYRSLDHGDITVGSDGKLAKLSTDKGTQVIHENGETLVYSEFERFLLTPEGVITTWTIALNPALSVSARDKLGTAATASDLELVTLTTQQAEGPVTVNYFRSKIYGLFIRAD